MSQWCDNNSHDMPQYLRQFMKWRDDVDENKFRSIIIFFIPVTDTVYMCNCHYMLFPFLLLHAARFWISQYCDMQIGYFYCWSKSHCWYVSLDLLIKRKYQALSKTSKYISYSFPAFPLSLQISAEILPRILSAPLLSMSSPCHHSLLSWNQCYTGCPRRKGPNFGRVFLRSNYTDITQNTYIQSWMFTDILAREKCGRLWCLRTVLRPWRHTRHTSAAYLPYR
jgi:hypothetical protein